MSDLAWVAAGFVLVYGTLTGYLLLLDVRRERVRRAVGGRR